MQSRGTGARLATGASLSRALLELCQTKQMDESVALHRWSLDHIVPASRPRSVHLKPCVVGRSWRARTKCKDLHSLIISLTPNTSSAERCLFVGTPRKSRTPKATSLCARAEGSVLPTHTPRPAIMLARLAKVCAAEVQPRRQSFIDCSLMFFRHERCVSCQCWHSHCWNCSNKTMHNPSQLYLSAQSLQLS